MEILQNKRKRGLAPITVPPVFADPAGGWIEKKSPVVSLAVVVTRNPEPQGPNQNQQRRRERPPPMMRVNQRRIKRRKVRSPLVVVPFESAQCGVNSKRTE